ncbi:hypothetical protein GOP47_0025629 [Adiantum capillus-veneris]|uniref:Carboxypeptidase n=1 Tax=Adiantum capillus-veneris TaxID=13818 RepID=A0A9D4U1R4_ADICA|nr:hypothetical protein GOP47_0025629 [Adiantum capillus-veneris]
MLYISLFLHVGRSLLCFLVVLSFESCHCRQLTFPRHGAAQEVHSPGPAEKLIRALNLIPTEMHPSPGHDLTSAPSAVPRLQEKRTMLKVMSKEAYLNGDEDVVSVDELGMRAGYFVLNGTYSAKMFYFFFESRSNNTDDPLMLWTTGGPGCGSELALFYENGPFYITSNLTLVWNDYGWDQISNIIFVDQPVGTGFSYTSDYRDIRHDEIGVSQDLYDFTQVFLNYHPEYRSLDFFVSGESYAGHYIPALATRIQEYNAQGKAYINLKGIAMGNGLTQPDIQYKAYSDYALQMGLIGDTAYKRIEKRFAVCKTSLNMCESEGGGVACAAAYLACNRIFDSVISLLGNTNYYDIRKECEGSLCYDFSDVTTFLNSDDVQETLGITDGYEWVACSSSVYDAMMLDWMRNAEKGIPSLLENNIQVLVYAGEYDLVCNWLGNFRWVSAMNWSDQQGFVEKNFTSFMVNGEEFAAVKSYGALSFMKMYNAGHMVPMDQPKAALEMMRRWTRGLSLEDGSVSKSFGLLRERASALNAGHQSL